ncbi:MAG: protein kinase [Planctomycetales bacterium]|nr:protein kinase [Planctomycetales bacterium]
MTRGSGVAFYRSVLHSLNPKSSEVNVGFHRRKAACFSQHGPIVAESHNVDFNSATDALSDQLEQVYETILATDDSNKQDRILDELRSEYDTRLIQEFEERLKQLRKAEQWFTKEIEDFILPAEQPGFQNGDCIGHFKILKELGAGGMGVVYLATDTRMSERCVALKMVSSAALAADQAETLHRFSREADIASRLNHDGIVKIFDLGQWKDQPYMAMQYVDGGTLADKLREQGRLNQRSAAELVAKLGDAMHHAHLRGVIHRDLKPANILLSSDGEPRITDFGIARDRASVPVIDKEASLGPLHAGYQEGTDDSVGTRNNAFVTSTGYFLGTVNYAAPEQILRASLDWQRIASESGEIALPRDITAQTDIYTLGVILYELLTGTVPFDRRKYGNDSEQVFCDIISRKPSSPSVTCQTVKIHCDVDAICLKCLNKQPEQRYASAHELANDLRRFLAFESVEANPAALPRRIHLWSRRHPAIASVLTLILLVVVASVWAVVNHNSVISLANQRLEERDETISNQLTVISENNVVLESEIERRNMLDRQRIAAEAKSRTERRLRYQNAAESLMQQDQRVAALPWLAAALEMVEDAESRQLLRLQIVNLLRRLPQVRESFFHEEVPRNFGFDQEGKMILVSSGRFATVWDSQTGQDIARFEHPENVLWASFNSQSLILTGSVDNRVRAWRTGQATPLWTSAVEPQDQLLQQGFVGESEVVFAIYQETALTTTNEKQNLFIKLWQSEDGQEIAELKLNTDARTYSSEGSTLSSYVQTISYASNSGHLFVRDGADVSVYEAKTGQEISLPHPISVSVGQIVAIETSHDGKSLALGADNRRLYVFDTSTGLARWPDGIVQPGIASLIRFSDDDEQIITGGRDYAFFYAWNARSGASVPFNYLNEYQVLNERSSMDGRMQLVGYEGNNVRLLDLAAGFSCQHCLILQSSVQSQVVSPSGRYVSFLSLFQNQNAIYTFDTLESRYLTSLGGNLPAFTGDETRLFVPAMGLQTLDLGTNELRSARPELGNGSFLDEIELSNDGKWIAARRGRSLHVLDQQTNELIVSRESDDDVQQMWINAKTQELVLLTYEQSQQPVRWSSIRRSLPNLELVTSVELPTQDAQLISVKASEDGGVLAGHGTDNLLRIWNTLSGEIICKLPVENLYTSEISPDGNYFAYSIWNNNVHEVSVWDISLNQPHSTRFVVPDNVNAIQISGDSTKIAAAARNNRVYVWQLTTGSPITISLEHDSSISSIGLSRDGSRLFVATENNKLWAWEISDANQWTDQELVQISEFLAASSIQDNVQIPLDGQSLQHIWESSQTKYQEFVTVKPSSLYIFNQRMAENCKENGLWQEQLKYLEVLADQYPNWYQFQLDLAEAYSKIRQPDKAFSAYERGLALWPENNAGRMQYAYALWRERKWQAVIDQSTIGLGDTKQLDALDTKGRVYREARFREYRADGNANLGNYAQAEADLRWLAENDSSHLWPLRKLALVLLAQGKVEDYEQLRANLLAPDGLGASEEADKIVEIGRMVALAPFESIEMRRRAYKVVSKLIADSSVLSQHIGLVAQVTTSDTLLIYLTRTLNQRIRIAETNSEYGHGPVSEYLGLAMIAHRYGNRAGAIRNLQVAQENYARYTADAETNWDSSLEFKFLIEKTKAEFERFPDTSLSDQLIGYLPPSELQLSELIELADARLEANPDDPLWLELRAQSLVQLAFNTDESSNDWRAIAEAFDRAFKADPQSSSKGFYTALLFAKAGDHEAHRSTCRTMLDNFLRSDKPADALTTMRACSLVDGSFAINQIKANDLVETVKRFSEPEFLYPDSRVSVGGFWFRTELVNSDETLVVYNKWQNSNVLRQIPWAVLVHLRKGAVVELKEALKLLATKREQLNDQSYARLLPWYQRLEFDLLATEAEIKSTRFLGSMEATQADPNSSDES